MMEKSFGILDQINKVLWKKRENEVTHSAADVQIDDEHLEVADRSSEYWSELSKRGKKESKKMGNQDSRTNTPVASQQQEPPVKSVVAASSNNHDNMTTGVGDLGSDPVSVDLKGSSLDSTARIQSGHEASSDSKNRASKSLECNVLPDQSLDKSKDSTRISPSKNRNPSKSSASDSVEPVDPNQDSKNAQTGTKRASKKFFTLKRSSSGEVESAIQSSGKHKKGKSPAKDAVPSMNSNSKKVETAIEVKHSIDDREAPLSASVLQQEMSTKDKLNSEKTISDSKTTEPSLADDVELGRSGKTSTGNRSQQKMEPNIGDSLMQNDLTKSEGKVTKEVSGSAVEQKPEAIKVTDGSSEKTETIETVPITKNNKLKETDTKNSKTDRGRRTSKGCISSSASSPDRGSQIDGVLTFNSIKDTIQALSKENNSSFVRRQSLVKKLDGSVFPIAKDQSCDKVQEKVKVAPKIDSTLETKILKFGAPSKGAKIPVKKTEIPFVSSHSVIGGYAIKEEPRSESATSTPQSKKRLKPKAPQPPNSAQTNSASVDRKKKTKAKAPLPPNDVTSSNSIETSSKSSSAAHLCDDIGGVKDILAAQEVENLQPTATADDKTTSDTVSSTTSRSDDVTNQANTPIEKKRSSSSNSAPMVVAVHLKSDTTGKSDIPSDLPNMSGLVTSPSEINSIIASELEEKNALSKSIQPGTTSAKIEGGRISNDMAITVESQGQSSIVLAPKMPDDSSKVHHTSPLGQTNVKADDQLKNATATSEIGKNEPIETMNTAAVESQGQVTVASTLVKYKVSPKDHRTSPLGQTTVKADGQLQNTTEAIGAGNNELVETKNTAAAESQGRITDISTLAKSEVSCKDPRESPRSQKSAIADDRLRSVAEKPGKTKQDNTMKTVVLESQEEISNVSESAKPEISSKDSSKSPLSQTDVRDGDPLQNVKKTPEESKLIESNVAKSVDLKTHVSVTSPANSHVSPANSHLNTVEIDRNAHPEPTKSYPREEPSHIAPLEPSQKNQRVEFQLQSSARTIPNSKPLEGVIKKGLMEELIDDLVGSMNQAKQSNSQSSAPAVAGTKLIGASSETPIVLNEPSPSISMDSTRSPRSQKKTLNRISCENEAMNTSTGLATPTLFITESDDDIFWDSGATCLPEKVALTINPSSDNKHNTRRDDIFEEDFDTPTPRRKFLSNQESGRTPPQTRRYGRSSESGSYHTPSPRFGEPVKNKSRSKTPELFTPEGSPLSDFSDESYDHYVASDYSGRSSSIPRRVYPQRSIAPRYNDDWKEESPVVFDAGLSFDLCSRQTPVRQHIRPSPAHTEPNTLSNSLSCRIAEFLNRTDHVMDEWSRIGKGDHNELSNLVQLPGKTVRSKSAANIMTKSFQYYSRGSSKCSLQSPSSSSRYSVSSERTLEDLDELSEMTADLAEERSSSLQNAQRLEAETSERIRLEQELVQLTDKKQQLEQSVEQMELELHYAKADVNGVYEGEADGDDGNVYKQQCARLTREVQLLRGRLTQQHEDDLEQLVGLKKQLEKKLADAYEEVEEQRQVVGQWKRKCQKIQTEMNDQRLIVEEQNSRNNLLEKKQRKFDAEIQMLQDELRSERSTRDRLSREKEVAVSEKFSLQQSLSSVRLELELKEEKLGGLSRELDELSAGGSTEHDLTMLRKSKHELEKKIKDQEDELDDLAGQVSILESAKLKLEMMLENIRKEHRKEVSQKEEEVDDVRSNAIKKIKSLEASLEQEHEERTLLLREKHELERRLKDIEELGRNSRAADEDALTRLRKDLRKTKALFRDAQVMLERAKQDSPSKATIRALKNQLEDSEIARSAAVKAKQSLEAELSETTSQLEEANRAKAEAESRAQTAVRQSNSLRCQLEENEEELSELMKKHRGTLQSLSAEQTKNQEMAVSLAELEADNNSLREQIAQLSARMETTSTVDPASDLNQRRLEIKAKDLESRLELEATVRARMEVQISRLKDNLERTTEECSQYKLKESTAAEQLRKVQRSLRECKEELAVHVSREQEAVQKRRDLEKRLEAAEHETTAAKNDLRLANLRVEDLQAALAGEINSDSDGSSDSESPDDCIISSRSDSRR